MPYPVYDVLELPNPFEQPGLTEELLLEALRAGQAQRAQATTLDAPTRGGTEDYFEQVVHFRRELLPHEWTYSNKNNFCTVISPDKVHAIAVAQGTRGTGLVDGEPETVRELGPVKGRVLDANVAQIELFGGGGRDVEEKPLTWFLLSRRQGRRVYSELSLPELMTETGVVYKWRQRWILDELDLDGVGLNRRDKRRDTQAESATEILVPIALKR